MPIWRNGSSPFGRYRFAADGLTRNGWFAIVQSLVVTICFFLAYRLVVSHAGLERLGIWSLLLVGSAITRIGDISGAGALARFVAIRSRDGETSTAGDTVHTVMLTSLAINMVLGFTLWLMSPLLLPMFLAPKYLAEAQSLVPFVVAIMVLGALAVSVTSAIDGAQRADQRAIVMILAAQIFLAASWILVPRFGILGFGIAQLIQQIAILIMGWLTLRRFVHGLGWAPFRWRRRIFSETTGYAVKLNAIGLLGLMFEPLAKFAFNYAGGPGLVALYELASRGILQIRSLAVSAAIPLIPALAAKSGPADPDFRQMLGKSTRTVAVAAVGIAIASLAAAPVISVIVLDRISIEMLAMNLALTVGWTLNLLSLGYYLAAQSVGLLRWNLGSHAIISASVLGGIYFLVPSFGSFGLIASIVLGLTLSMVIALFGNAYSFGAVDVVQHSQRRLLSSSFSIVVLGTLYGLALAFMNQQ